ncbi:AI-2E family transporter [Vagococcus xieshaowenii]|uniref:AI-2E family transporter n=1 Tax=Vagococcus xieshaowenii TaxID=2562451 RepID=A0A4Z0D4U6_9ENTE|nr:AI-2E family transporter [Vagococcus xieshaowenii]QCA29375.1 AI-2E family transporter [Vagococcus xieshaowenii]TFZ39333.1 AI-2E family transporter [Vagococcus xieshaowenii]
MSIYQKFIENIKLRRFVILFSIILLLYITRSFISYILFTFIFTYLFLSMKKIITKRVPIPPKIVISVLYSLVVFFLYIALTKYVPIIINQSVHLIETISDFYANDQTIKHNNVTAWIMNYLNEHNIFEQLQKSTFVIFDYLTSVGHFTFKFVMSFVLSFFYCIEEERMKNFSKNFLTSDLGWLFEDILYFAKKFIGTFGVVIEAQLFIAICNTVLMIIPMMLLGYGQIPSLILMIFLMSLVPVAGAIISTIPLSFIAYYQGGVDYVFYMILMIIIIHLFESYFLNPKFMSNRTHLPTFYTFVILVISEQVFGIWGLIVGIPIFVFFLDIINVTRSSIKKET